jgi:multiple sugar transport system substrate-binding protein
MTRLRIALGAVASVALAASVTACSSDTPDKSSTAPNAPVTVWVMGDSSANFEKLVQPYTVKTGAKVKVVAIPWDGIDQKFTTSVAAGQGPDVMQVGLSKLRTFADSGALLALDGKLDEYKNLSSDKFVDAVSTEATKVNGKQYSVPWVSDTRVLFYRSDVLAKSGINAAPTTWDQLRADAKTLAGRGKGQYGYYIPQWDSPLPVMMTWDQGGDIINADGKVDLNTPAFDKAVELYTGLYADKSVPTAGDFDQVQGFVSGTAPMVVSGPYFAKAVAEAAPELEGKWAATTLPSAAKGTSLFAGSNLAALKSTKNEAGSLALLDYLSQPQTQLTWFELNGELPTAKAALSDAKLNSDPNVAVYVKQLSDAKLLPLIPNWDGGLGADLLKALNSVVLQGADKDKTISDLQSSAAQVSLK